jgi:hypothetical protein
VCDVGFIVFPYIDMRNIDMRNIDMRAVVADDWCNENLSAGKIFVKIL